MAELIIVTGGACAGKTSLVEALAARGHDVVPETAIEVIEALNRERGVAGQVTWREANLVEFQRRVGLVQHAREAAARERPSRFVFCDRGLLDGLAYCVQAGVEWPDELHAVAAPARYAHVFVLDTLAAFTSRPETGRIDSRDESVEVGAILDRLYRERAPSVTRLGEVSIDDRLDLVLRTLAGR